MTEGWAAAAASSARDETSTEDCAVVEDATGGRGEGAEGEVEYAAEMEEFAATSPALDSRRGREHHTFQAGSIGNVLSSCQRLRRAARKVTRAAHQSYR